MSTAPAECDRPETVHVVVTCTNRKTRSVSPELRLGSVTGRSCAGRAGEWVRRLAESRSEPLITAEDLYAGEHWLVARGLPNSGGPVRIRLWVCSAGYGLIPARAQVRPYAATFSGPSDCVPGGRDGAREWWSALSRWEGPAVGQPRSIRALAAADPSSAFLVALSAAYLGACRDDVVEAAAQVANPDQFMVISAGARFPGNVATVMVPASARLQAFLGGTRQALNVRTVAHLLSMEITSRAEGSRHLTRLLAEQAPVRRYERKKLSDDEVCAMITSRLEELPGLSASRMLRELRDSGYACEQQRFGQLHRSVIGVRR